MQETEQQLLDAIHDGDPKALRRLYDRYVAYATAIAQRYIHDREDVRDMLQDSFIKILTCVADFEFRGEGSLKAWVSTVVVNRAIDWVKLHERLQMTSVIPDLIEENPPDLEHVPPEVLNGMIGRLPAGCRLVLNLRVFEQLSHKDIAHRLGIRESSSASQFSRAKQLLQKMIQEYLNSQRI